MILFCLVAPVRTSEDYRIEGVIEKKQADRRLFDAVRANDIYINRIYRSPLHMQQLAGAALGKIDLAENDTVHRSQKQATVLE